MKNYALVSGFIVAVLGLLVLLVWAGSRTTLKTASADDPNRPIATLEGEPHFDLGKMKVNEIKDHEFTIKNTGKSNLELGQVATSCDCTYAYIIKNGESSPKFTMHGMNDWKTTLMPDETAIVKAVYEPAIMPVEGKVERVVVVTTNDPVSPKIEFAIMAEVSK